MQPAGAACLQRIERISAMGIIDFFIIGCIGLAAVGIGAAVTYGAALLMDRAL